MTSVRLHIGGLHELVTDKELQQRFESFGKISDVQVIRNAQGRCKGFGYVTLDGDENLLKKCTAALNNAKWKGHVLHISQAKMEYKAKLEKEWEEQRIAALPPPPPDPNAKVKKLFPWKRGKGGRMLPVMHITKSNGKTMLVDPSKLKDNITIFDGTLDDSRMKPISELTWSYSDPSPRRPAVPAVRTVPRQDDEIADRLRKEKAKSLALLSAMGLSDEEERKETAPKPEKKAKAAPAMETPVEAYEEESEEEAEEEEEKEKEEEEEAAVEIEEKEKEGQDEGEPEAEANGEEQGEAHEAEVEAKGDEANAEEPEESEEMDNEPKESDLRAALMFPGQQKMVVTVEMDDEKEQEDQDADQQGDDQQGDDEQGEEEEEEEEEADEQALDKDNDMADAEQVAADEEEEEASAPNDASNGEPNSEVDGAGEEEEEEKKKKKKKKKKVQPASKKKKKFTRGYSEAELANVTTTNSRSFDVKVPSLRALLHPDANFSLLSMMPAAPEVPLLEQPAVQQQVAEPMRKAPKRKQPVVAVPVPVPIPKEPAPEVERVFFFEKDLPKKQWEGERSHFTLDYKKKHKSATKRIARFVQRVTK